MKKELFEELVTSVQEAGEIHRGERKPARTFVAAKSSSSSERRAPAEPALPKR
jgi:hypothetical protein